MCVVRDGGAYQHGSRLRNAKAAQGAVVSAAPEDSEDLAQVLSKTTDRQGTG